MVAAITDYESNAVRPDCRGLTEFVCSNARRRCDEAGLTEDDVGRCPVRRGPRSPSQHAISITIDDPQRIRRDGDPVRRTEIRGSRRANVTCCREVGPSDHADGRWEVAGGKRREADCAIETKRIRNPDVVRVPSDTHPVDDGLRANRQVLLGSEAALPDHKVGSLVVLNEWMCSNPRVDGSVHRCIRSGVNAACIAARCIVIAYVGWVGELACGSEGEQRGDDAEPGLGGEAHGGTVSSAGKRLPDRGATWGCRAARGGARAERGGVPTRRASRRDHNRVTGTIILKAT